ncbi:hypothetical protein HY604_05020 [Candidatus Peregrinibacteria bacterium]|nr:hypothetical protein [Candidatus Peregrinibacteria bacterium]
MSDSLKNRFKKMPSNKKMILVCSFLTVISLFMPWYSDIDQFKTGDGFLGITGPLYMAGILILILNVASLGLVAMEFFDKPEPKLPISTKQFHILSGSISTVLLVLMLSVYFHPKFGINLTNKSAEFGMILGFIGMAGVIFGALMKQKTVTGPKIEIDFEDRVQKSVETSGRIPTIEELTREINKTSDLNIHDR